MVKCIMEKEHQHFSFSSVLLFSLKELDTLNVLSLHHASNETVKEKQQLFGCSQANKICSHWSRNLSLLPKDPSKTAESFDINYRM